MERSKAKFVNCVQDINGWMLSNQLKLNNDKSEVLVISSSRRPQPSLSSLDICNETVSCCSSARNIGVIFYHETSDVIAFCTSSFFHLRNIRKYLTPDAAKIVIHAFIVSKLDYCNSLLYRLPLVTALLSFSKTATCSTFCCSSCNSVSRILSYYSGPQRSSLASCSASHRI